MMTSTKPPAAHAIRYAIRSHKCQRFPWQFFIADGRCVLVSRGADAHAVIRWRYSPQHDAPLAVPLASIPLDVARRVRLALGEAAR